MLIALEIGTPSIEAGVPSVDKFMDSLHLERSRLRGKPFLKSLTDLWVGSEPTTLK
jgi:hypothetical protein